MGEDLEDIKRERETVDMAQKCANQWGEALSFYFPKIQNKSER